MVGHFGHKHTCLVEKNVPIALILPSRWQDGAESLGLESTSCICYRDLHFLLNRLMHCKEKMHKFISRQNANFGFTISFWLWKVWWVQMIISATFFLKVIQKLNYVAHVLTQFWSLSYTIPRGVLYLIKFDASRTSQPFLLHNISDW